MVCGIHRGMGTGEGRLKLVFCCSTREETGGWIGMKEGVVSLQLLPHTPVGGWYVPSECLLGLEPGVNAMNWEEGRLGKKTFMLPWGWGQRGK